MAKIDNGSVTMTIEFPGDVYYFLARISEKDRRSMKKEILYLIEKEAGFMGIELDMEHPNVRNHFLVKENFKIKTEYNKHDRDEGFFTSEVKKDTFLKKAE